MPIGFKTEDTKKADKETIEDLRDPEGIEKPTKLDTKMMVILLLAIGIIVIIIFAFNKKSDSPAALDETFSPNSNQENADYSETTPPATQNPDALYDEDGELLSNDGIYDLDGNALDKNAIDPGVKENETINANKTSAKVYNAKDFIKDLNGANVSAVYNVKSRDYVEDYVNYTSRRAIMDKGMELYWIDVVYRKKNYRVQIPFFRFKDMQEEGICRVEMEVLSLEGGGKIISYMQVVDDIIAADD